MQPKQMLRFSYININITTKCNSKLRMAAWQLVCIHVVLYHLHNCELPQAHICWVVQVVNSVNEKQLCRCHVLSPIIVIERDQN